MTFDEFIMKADADKFYDSSPEERLKFAQEYENMMAELEHRDPCTVVELPEEYAKENPGVMGYCAGEIIAINKKYLNSKKPKVPGLSSFGFADLIETLTHEGRHAWQHYVIDHPEKNLVDEHTRIALEMNLGPGYRGGSGKGIQGYAEYAAQLVELDARHFAMDWIQHLQKSFEEKDGVGISEFAAKYKKLYNQVAINAQYIVEYLDANKLKACEERLKKEMYPGLDTSGVSMFADAIDLLHTMDSLAFIDSRPIDTRLDVMDGLIDNFGISGIIDRTVIKHDDIKIGKVKGF